VDRSWSVIRKAVVTAWRGHIRPALRALHGFVDKQLIPVITFLWRNVVQPYFRGIGRVIKFAWQNVVRPVFRAWWAYMDGALIPVIKFLWERVVRPVMGFIGRRIRDVWRNTIRPVFRALGDFIGDTLVPAFKSGVEAIGDAWDGLKKLAAKPVNFVIDTVYNNGIRKLFNQVASTLRSDVRLKEMPRIATGGAGGHGGHAHGVTSAMGGPLSWIKDTAGKGLNWLKGKAGDSIEPLISKIGKGPFAGLLKDATKRLLSMAIGNFRGDEQLKKGVRGKVLPAGSYRIGMPYLGYPGHHGADYPAPTGTPVKALKSGIVTRAMSLAGSYGKHVFIAHPGGIETRYAHLSAFGVKPGDKVTGGAQIGRVGSTGNSTGPHLHFEYRRGGRPVNPAGLGVFDSGGMLPPGLSAVFNGTRKPEAVFTHDQFRTLERIANSGDSGSGFQNHQHFPTTDKAAAVAAADRAVAALNAKGR
jgi:hypothetical protein